MKRFIRISLLFSIFSSICYIISILILGYSGISGLHINFKILDSPSRSLLRVQDIQKIDSVDILFLGSSRSFMGFDTRIFNAKGFSAFNFGTAAQTPVQTAMLIDRYLDSISPKLVIYEVYLEGFENDGIESAIDLLSSDYIDLNSFNMTKLINEPVVYHAFLFAALRQSFGYMPHFTESPGGYLPMSGYIRRPVLQNKEIDKNFPTRNFQLCSYQWISFLKIINKLRERNIQYVLVQAPIPSARYDAVTNKNSLQNSLRKQGELLVFNELISLDDSLHFEDASHLNQTGVEIFNLKLIELLFNYPHKYRKN